MRFNLESEPSLHNEKLKSRNLKEGIKLIENPPGKSRAQDESQLCSMAEAAQFLKFKKQSACFERFQNP
jgi:hypothetical protein